MLSRWALEAPRSPAAMDAGVAEDSWDDAQRWLSLPGSRSNERSPCRRGEYPENPGSFAR